MENLTNIIEAILFASGKSVALEDISEKLNITNGELRAAVKELKERYGEKGGIRLLEFNKKLQLATNPEYKDAVYAVLNPIREKELTRALLECAAIVAYKQPITRTEIEILRGLNSDYAVKMLLDLKLIYPCGRKDAVGRPVLFATTDEFLKRFKLGSLEELPDYDELMTAIHALHADERDSYLYAREDGIPEDEEAEPVKEEAAGESEEKKRPSAPKESGEEVTADGYEIPDFLRCIDSSDLVKIS